jgi:hypothetical protein
VVELQEEVEAEVAELQEVVEAAVEAVVELLHPITKLMDTAANAVLQASH